jgi:SAM-dependent methyltransferase
MTVPKWDDRYRDVAKINKQPAATLVRALAMWTNPPGDALDIACGAGRHSVYLANAGWRVTAVDASQTALNLIRQESRPNIQTVNADLEDPEFSISRDRYHLICDFYYLHRDLFPQIRNGLKSGGLFVAEIPMLDDRPGVAAMNPLYLLQPGELARIFVDWELLEYDERIPGDKEQGGHRRKVATLIARKPLRE